MKSVTSLILYVAVLVGGAAGVLAFQHAAPQHAAASTPPAAAAVSAPATHRAAHARHARLAPVRKVVRWAPCPSGSTLEAGVCVTDVVRTATLPAPAAPAVSTVGHTGGAGPSHHVSGGEHESHGEHGDGGEHEGGGD